MADLLTHVLVPYVALTIAGWVVEFDDRWVPVAMGGAAIPDLVKIDIVLDEAVVQRALGVPFEWTPVGSLAGVLLIAAIVSLPFEAERRRAYGLLVAGGVSSLALDGLRVYADGRADFWLFPLWWRPPTPSLYVTSNPAVTATAVAVAAAVFAADRYVVDTGVDRSDAGR